MKRLLMLALALLTCVFNDKGVKTSDCNYCGCSTSQHYGDHSPYNGKCLHCGAPC